MYKKLCIITALTVFCVFNGWARKFKQEQFVNLLNIEVGYEITPNGFLFADLGNWHGYGFNNPSDLSNAGGFRGPAFIGEKKISLQWLSDCFEKLTLVGVDGKTIPYTQIVSSEYLPGMLRLHLKAKNLEVKIREIAITNRGTMIEYQIINTGNEPQTIKANFTGNLTYKDAKLTQRNNLLCVSVVNDKHQFIFSLPRECQISKVTEKNYHAESEKMNIRPGKVVVLHSFSTYSPAVNQKEALNNHHQIEHDKTDKYFKQNKERWEGYLSKVLNRPTPYLQSERYRNWAVKALMTLNTNWRSAAGDLKHAGLFPATGHFDAFWAWDSWEHATAVAIFNPELAKDQMRTMFDYQTPEGMIVDLISLDRKENNIVCSKPPIAGWATYMVYQRSKDKAFIKEMLPKLLKYHEWRYKYRDHDQNGLCEYGGTGSKVYMGQWESGMDVAVKFHGVKMLKNAPEAYSFDQESIELNSYLCAEKFYLAFMLDEVGDKETAAKYRKEGNELKKNIQEKFFDKETGYFYDRKLGTGELVKVIDISGWIPLLTKVATPKQAEAVKNNMLSPELFGTYFPFSSLNHKHPLYQPDKGYFRGQTWMNYTYFGIRGFKNYGFTEEATKYTWLLPDRLKGLTEPGMPIRENWNSATGEGMTARHFGWSSAFSILLLGEDADKFMYVP
ncbi:hypothetical protein HC965_03945 [Bacteroides sp. GM023]|nr:hypothetical protein [Bacteroides sp. GM023]